MNERETNGPFGNLSDFIERVHGRDINKRSIENLIKAGALDCFEGNRRQKLSVYSEVLDTVNDRSKGQVAGQITLFDLADDTAKESFRAALPPLPEFDKTMLLSFEKEVMGIYISGHPLEDDLPMLKKNVTATSLDFMLPEEGSEEGEEEGERVAKIADNRFVTVGGVISERTNHFTKTNQPMAFVTIEDMTGTIEIIFFPKTFERYRDMLNEDEKILIRGRSSVEENKDAKLIAESAMRFADVPSTLWVNFSDRAAYDAGEGQLLDLVRKFPGDHRVMVYLSTEKQRKDLLPGGGVALSAGILDDLCGLFGKEHIYVSPGRAVFR